MIEIYTLRTCPFCVRAKQVLESRGLEYTEHEMSGRSAELREIKSKWGHPTVPIVILDGRLVGGCDDLEALAASGRLPG